MIRGISAPSVLYRQKQILVVGYVSRKVEGMGLMQIEGASIPEVMKLMEYVERKEDSLIRIVRTHQYHINSALLRKDLRSS
jgi:hypothetical protein